MMNVVLNLVSTSPEALARLLFLCDLATLQEDKIFKWEDLSAERQCDYIKKVSDCSYTNSPLAFTLSLREAKSLCKIVEGKKDAKQTEDPVASSVSN